MSAGLEGLLIERAASSDRKEMIRDILCGTDAKAVAEVGVLRGDLAEYLLRSLPDLATYYLVDPWRHLSDWNKPANRPEDEFQSMLAGVRQKLAPYGDRTEFRRGRTVEVIDGIPDGSLDAVYIDGDHTLRGIMVDLVCWYPKVRDGGLLMGDDFSPTIWQHKAEFEPTFVFPAAVHFAEGMGDRIYALPGNQFVILKDSSRRDHVFTDLVGRYPSTEVRAQLRRE